VSLWQELRATGVSVEIRHRDETGPLARVASLPSQSGPSIGSWDGMPGRSRCSGARCRRASAPSVPAPSPSDLAAATRAQFERIPTPALLALHHGSRSALA
jgi:hypothetical protein